MKQTIYIDVLLAVNLFVNYFLLLSVSCFLRMDGSRKRIALGAAVGAVSSLIILLPSLPGILSAVVKLLLSAAIVTAAFPLHSVWSFLRVWACFFLMSFAFAGIMMALWYFLAPQGLILKNSVVYFNISPMLLLVLTVICYFVIRVLNWLSGRREQAGDLCIVAISNAGHDARIPARIDTGSSLKEPFSQFPVIVAEYEAVKEALPQELVQMREQASALVPSVKIRMVPFHALGGSGILPAFRPDRVAVKSIDGTVETSAVYVAVCETKLSETFHALLNPEILAGGRKINKGGTIFEKGTGRHIR